MSSKWNRLRKTLGIAIPTSAAVLAVGAGSAWAQTTYIFEGSDTLTDIMNNAIAAWDTPANNPTGNHLQYSNIGSGQAEKNMQNTGGGSHPYQSIGPMSRNFGSTVLAAYPSWTPTADNVVALDAGIFSVGTYKTSYCQNLTITTDGLSPMAILLAGYPATSGQASKATVAECADSRRLDALAVLTACQNASRIDHIYRRDDKSGTQDTFREKLGFSRWCNGKSEGNNNAVGSNLLNEDLDPIRRPCVGSGSTRQPTRCTFYPLNYPLPGDPPCTNGDVLAANHAANTLGVPLNCSQGLVVALSEDDPDGTGGKNDITKSIGNRVALDNDAQRIGLAGMASIGGTFLTNTGTRLNGTTYEYANIRNGAYPISRKLFVQRNASFVTSPAAGDADRFAAETSFFNFVTNRCSMLSIVKNAGFLSPLVDQVSKCNETCSGPYGTAAGNISCFGNDVAGSSAPKMNIGAYNETCVTGYPWVQTGSTCASGATPPALDPLLANDSACSFSAWCASGSCCPNSIGVAGTCVTIAPTDPPDPTPCPGDKEKL